MVLLFTFILYIKVPITGAYKRYFISLERFVGIFAIALIAVSLFAFVACDEDGVALAESEKKWYADGEMFWGIMSPESIIGMVFTQVVVKTLYELVVLPVTTLCVRYLKRKEQTDVYDENISYNPFRIGDL